MLRCAGDEIFDEPLQRILAGGGRCPEVTLELAGVRQQMTDRDLRAGPLVVGSEAWQVHPHRNVQLDKALIHELHHQRCGPDLGDRLDHEQRIWCRLDPRAQVHHTGRGLDRLPIDEHRDGRPRNFVLGHQAWQLRVQQPAGLRQGQVVGVGLHDFHPWGVSKPESRLIQYERSRRCVWKSSLNLDIRSRGQCAMSTKRE